MFQRQKAPLKRLQILKIWWSDLSEAAPVKWMLDEEEEEEEEEEGEEEEEEEGLRLKQHSRGRLVNKR